MSYDPRSPTDAADHDPDTGRTDRRRGIDANRAGKPFDPRQNIDWQTGWEEAQADRGLDEED